MAGWLAAISQNSCMQPGLLACIQGCLHACEWDFQPASQPASQGPAAARYGQDSEIGALKENTATPFRNCRQPAASLAGPAAWCTTTGGSARSGPGQPATEAGSAARGPGFDSQASSSNTVSCQAVMSHGPLRPALGCSARQRATAEPCTTVQCSTAC